MQWQGTEQPGVKTKLLYSYVPCCGRLAATCAVFALNDAVELLLTVNAFGITGRERIEQNTRISYQYKHVCPPGSSKRKQSGVACRPWMRSVLLASSKSSPFTTRNRVS